MCSHTTVPMADSLHQVASLRNSTIVLSLPRGVKVGYADFSPALEPFKGKFVAFGSVGVSYIWHLTMRSVGDVDAFVDRGDFEIGDIWVRVSRFTDICNVATLHWLPFWIPHSDVVSSLCKLLGSRLTCQYIQIPQKGYEGCFTTQRRIEAPVALDKLPHFIQIDSEGQSYRTFLFVPGRQSVCFACGEFGHMKSSCGNDKRKRKGDEQTEQPIKKLIVPAEVVDSSDVTITEPSESIISEDRSSSMQCESQDGSDAEYSDSFYTVKFLQRDGSFYKLAEEGKVLHINPPLKSRMTKDEIEAATWICMHHGCDLLRHWEEGLISANDLRSHFSEKHPGSKVLKVKS